VPRLAVVLLAAAALAGEPAVIGDGHVDVGPRYLDGDWTIQIRDDTVEPPAWRALDDVVLRARDAARLEVPADERFRFLGRPGERVWLLPQVQRDGVLWPGWNTQEVAREIRREMTWTLHGVEGPGRFVLFSNGEFGAPEVIFDGSKPYPQVAGVEAGTHVHGNWAFSRAGAYRLDISMSATTRDGEPVSDRETLRFLAGEGEPAAALEEAGGFPWMAAAAAGGLVLVGLVVIRRRRG
jgi:putative ABC transporter-associated repeat protein